LGLAPSEQLAWAQNLYSVVSLPLVVILKIVPPLLVVPPPSEVVPYKYPFLAWISAPTGYWPSVHAPPSEQKLYSVVNVPFGVILKIVP
jgi:hypothetical protein